MKAVLGFLCVLLVVIAKGEALSCTTCLSMQEASCNGPSVSCPPDNMCGAFYTLTTARGIQATQNYVKGCIPKTQCGTEGRISVINQVNSQIDISCCNTDNCTPPEPKLPTLNSNPNGLVCRTCVSMDSDWCYTDDTVQCSGNENRCLLQRTNIKGPISLKTAIRGCATKSVCDIGNQYAEQSGVKVESKFICTSGSLRLYSGISLSFIVAIFLIKLLS